MAWGDSFRSVWDDATNASRATVSAIATGARAVGDATASIVQTLARESEAVAKSAEQKVERGAKALPSAALEAANEATEAARWAAEQTEKAAVWAVKKGVRAERALSMAAVATVKAITNAAASAYVNAKKAFSAATAAVATVACTKWNWDVNVIGMTAAAVLTKPGISDLVRPLLQFGGNDKQARFDGDVIGKGCQKKGPNLSAGVMPPSCHQKPGTLPQVSYVNGINTDFMTPDPFKSAGICKTMQEIAKITCSEVTGVYNATEGMGRDLDECLDNIAKASTAPSVVPLRYMIVQAARSGRAVTLFAHSQGGLITQEAVAQAKQELMAVDHLTKEEAEQKLGKVSIKSFGTAVMGWPKGPHYERFTNTADPVPAVITGAETSYPIETWEDSAGADQHHVFTSPHANPIDSHSMDDTYLPQYAQIKGAPHCACKAG